MRYNPTIEERLKCDRLVAGLTPSSETYDAYRLRANHYHYVCSPRCRVGGSDETVHGVSFRNSKLFPDYQYLVAFVEDEWFKNIAPLSTAAAVPWSQRETGLFAFQTPPLVYVPSSKRRLRNTAFLSILEHEFVHINQALLDRYPKDVADTSTDELVRHFLERMRAEYEANFVQLVRWPHLYKVECGYSIERWCVVVGCAQAFHHFYSAAYDLELSATEVEQFLDTVRDALPDSIAALDVDGAIPGYFEERLGYFVSRGLLDVLESRPGLEKFPGFVGVRSWLDSNDR